jgi:hypothetical protein
MHKPLYLQTRSIAGNIIAVTHPRCQPFSEISAFLFIWIQKMLMAHFDSVTFHIDSVTFHIDSVTFHIDGVTFHIDSVTFHIDGVKFHIDGVTFHIDSVKFHISTGQRQCLRAPCLFI